MKKNAIWVVLVLALCLGAVWFFRGSKQPDKAKPEALASGEIKAANAKEDTPPAVKDRGKEIQVRSQAASLPAQKQASPVVNAAPAATKAASTAVPPVVGNPEDMEKRDEFGATALHTAVAGEDRAAVKNLLANGADVNARNAEGYTSLMLAAERNNLDLVKDLLAAGSDVNVQNLYGDTALFMAVWGGQMEMAEVLMKAGADPRIKNHDDQTPLMFMEGP
ncbi:MAG: ankyrin repeat domain-containing protein [Kiritimatiellia bacterium]|jgi:ankyrin repeat protein